MIIEIENLKKTFKDVKAVDGLSFNVSEGELFAFLGLNGAGKSTTINIMCGVLKKDGGSVRICGYDAEREQDAVKGSLGVVFQNSVLDKKLTVADNLKCRANLYGISGGRYKSRLEEMCKLLELKEILDRPVGKLSGGQRRRADIARALFHRPRILILDEPTTGLDPRTRITVWKVVDGLRQEAGLTVFLTTHYMEESANADRVVILDCGKKVAEGTPHDLKNQFASDFVRFYGDIEEVAKYFASHNRPVSRGRGYVQLELESTAEVPALIGSCPQFFNDFEVLKGNMDNVFLKVTGKDLQI